MLKNTPHLCAMISIEHARRVYSAMLKSNPLINELYRRLDFAPDLENSTGRLPEPSGRNDKKGRNPTPDANRTPVAVGLFG